MKPEAQRIAMAEACGWESIRMAEMFDENDGWEAPVGKRTFISGKQDYAADGTELPDYLNDLNAMHEAEKVLTDVQQHIYAHKLLLIFERTSNMGSNSFTYAHATAVQRAEAFLRTVGKWEESA